MEELYSKHYIRVDTQNRVTFGYSDYFDYNVVLDTDICINEQGGMQFELFGVINPDITEEHGVYIFKYLNAVLSKRTAEEIQADIDAIFTIRSSKKEEVSQYCQNTIFSGFDVETSKGTKHFSLTIEDQTNLNGAYNAVLQGTEAYPYHANGELCEMYSAEDIKTMSAAAVAFKLYHVTYCNHLNVWINRSEAAEEIKAIYYGIELPEDLKANFESIIGAGATGNETAS